MLNHAPHFSCTICLVISFPDVQMQPKHHVYYYIDEAFFGKSAIFFFKPSQIFLIILYILVLVDGTLCRFFENFKFINLKKKVFV